MSKNRFSQFESPLNSKSFGFLSNGDEVMCFILKNKYGIDINIINYGETITSIKVPVSNTKKIDVVLGFDNVEDYINSFNLLSAPYLGALVGRYAGRKNNANFKLNNESIQLTKNLDEHCIHGGNAGFSKAIWKVISLSDNSITLHYCSAATDENFPDELACYSNYLYINRRKQIKGCNGGKIIRRYYYQFNAA